MTALPTPDEVNAMVATQFPGHGNRCVELGPGFALARRDIGPMDIRPGDYISGPTQFGLADASLWFLSFAILGRIEPMAVTSELSIRFVRPAIGQILWARATVDSAGSRRFVGTSRIWVDGCNDRPSAVAQGSYAFPEPPGPGGSP